MNNWQIKLPIIWMVYFCPLAWAHPPHTFIFWIHGDADQKVATLDLENNQDSEEEFRADQLEVDRLHLAARNCLYCQVLIVHDQRHEEDQLWVYEKGKLTLQEELGEINGGDPRFLAHLIDLAYELFPSANLHLIYRGHGLMLLEQHSALVFDQSHPQQKFGPKQFAKGVSESKIYRETGQVPLQTITFASCEMASLEMVVELQGLASFMMASQVTIPQHPPFGFDYSFLNTIRPKDTPLEVAYKMSSGLLSRFRKRVWSSLAFTETPLTLLDLRLSESKENKNAWSPLKRSWYKLKKYINQKIPQSELKELIQNSRPDKRLSEIYVENLKVTETRPQFIQKAIQKIRRPSQVTASVDVLKFFTALEMRPVDDFLLSEVIKLQNEVSKLIIAHFDSPTFSDKTGLSATLEFSTADKISEKRCEFYKSVNYLLAHHYSLSDSIPFELCLYNHIH